jgi:hypothetical protein
MVSLEAASSVAVMWWRMLVGRVVDWDLVVSVYRFFVRPSDSDESFVMFLSTFKQTTGYVAATFVFLRLLVDTHIRGLLRLPYVSFLPESGFYTAQEHHTTTG